MLFNSLHFLIFFPIVVTAFFSIPHRFRWALLLAASYYFYMAWEPAYGLLIFFSTVVDYVAARLIGGTEDMRRRRLLLGASLLVNLGILFFFKYFNFFFDAITPLINVFNADYSSPVLALLLPVGISFYTFQSLSYTIDVYRGKRTPEKHFGIFALYVSFFPQLVAGPIETSTRLLPQFYKKIAPEAERFASGLRLMLWGFFKKIVIADNAALIVNAIYSDPGGVNGIALFIATFFFAVQIYGDFSGYSDIARGAARVLGYDLILNFNRPYFSRSVAEFWRRWHISLMRWFKEYVYIPLGGSRGSSYIWLRNISLVFLISGIWHGANWTFIVWGLLNALYIIVGKYTHSTRAHIQEKIGLIRLPFLQVILQTGTTFLLTLLAWVFFRAQSVSDGVLIVSRVISDTFSVITNPGLLLPMLREAGLALSVSKEQLLSLTGALALLVLVEIYLEKRQSLSVFLKLPKLVRWSVYYALIAYIIFFGHFGESAFIYFQF